jgi:hypothetical protein
MCHGLPLQGVYMKDILPTKLKDVFFVLNLDKESGNGTHWTVLYKKKNTISYFDSFGCPLPERETKIVKGKDSHCYYSDRIIQDLKSVLCGFYCVAFILYFHEHRGNLVEKLEDFHDLFYDNGTNTSNANGKKNDASIKKYILSHFNK